MTHSVSLVGQVANFVQTLQRERCPAYQIARDVVAADRQLAQILARNFPRHLERFVVESKDSAAARAIPNARFALSRETDRKALPAWGSLPAGNWLGRMLYSADG